MRLTLLGTGDAAGMPLYGCDCDRCTRARGDAHYRRAPTSALLEVGNARYLIDAGLMDIAERFPSASIDGIFLTHFHPDHVQGLFHLRWGRGENIPVYCPPDSMGCADLFKHPGILNFQVQRKYQAINGLGFVITPLPLIHSKPTFGYLIEKGGRCVAYLVDTKDVPPRVEHLLREKDLDVLVIDTSSAPGVENLNHNNLDDTLSLHQRIGAGKTIMTHINHDFDLWLRDHAETLPETVIPGYDGCIAFSLNA